MVTSDAQDSRLLILFGTQTGNSKDVAERVAREAKRLGFKPSVMAMDAFAVASLPQESRVVFIAATTGQGELPSNMKKFWRFLLRKSLPLNSLSSTKYAVFGLGDSGYVDYNVVAKKLDRRLSSLGAVEIIPRGLGDDQHPFGYEAALDPWLSELWTKLRAQMQSSAELAQEGAIENGKNVLDPPHYRVSILHKPMTNTAEATNGHSEPQIQALQGNQEVDSTALQLKACRAAYEFSQLEAREAGMSQQHDILTKPIQNASPDYGPHNPCVSSMVENTRITALDHFQDTRHIAFDLGKDTLQYDPGDIISIWPCQSDAAVQKLLDLTGYSPDTWIRVELNSRAAGGSKVSMEAQLGSFVQGCLDVNSASPRRYFFEVLQHFATDELQRERLEYFASAEGREDLALYNQNEGRTVLEVLQDFHSARLPLDWLIQLCPRLQPRQFSIACSQAAHPQEAHITLAVVNYRTPHKRPKQGLCSTWLASLQKGAKVSVWIEKGVLSLPKDPQTPLVMIGPGTGIAPFRAFLEEREALQSQGISVAPSYLYFGSRSKDKDFYYQELWQRLLHKGILAEDGGLVTAFSRDMHKKVYVTHKLEQNAAQIFRLLKQGAYIYVSGSAKKMPQEVAAVIRDRVLVQQGGMASNDASTFMKQLVAQKRYVVEAWS